MSRHVLITRPVADTGALAEKIERAGFIPVVAPLLTVTLLPDAVPDLAGAAALVLTSARAVHALPDSASVPVFTIPVFAVGEATASAARAAGFTQVTVAAGDVRALRAAVAGAGVRGSVYYLSGADITEPLAIPGISIERHVVYRTDPVDGFAPPVVALFEKGDVAAVMLMSRRTGQACARAVDKQGLASFLSATKALCLSDSVLESVAHLLWGATRVAARPDSESLCALLQGGNL